MMLAYELRIYQIAPGAIAMVEDIFRDVVAPMLPTYGIKGIGFWSSVDGSMLYYVVEHGSEQSIEENWKCFHADPRWQPALDKHEHGRTGVIHTQSVHLQSIDYLPPAAT